jgi:hypothetical protein
MQEENNKQTEKFLKNFSFKPAPSTLKGKILNDILQLQKTIHMMTAHLWKGVVGCLLLLIFVIAIDATITHAQNKRFASFLHKEQESIDITEEERAMIKDIIGEFLDSTKIEVKIKLYNFHKKTKKGGRQTEWRESFEKEFE